MSDDMTLDQSQLVDRLADGFAALLKQLEELKRHNEEVEKLLGYEHKVHPSHVYMSFKSFIK